MDNFLEQLNYHQHPAYKNIKFEEYDEVQIKKVISDLDKKYYLHITKNSINLNKNYLQNLFSKEINTLRELFAKKNHTIMMMLDLILDDVIDQFFQHSNFFKLSNASSAPALTNEAFLHCLHMKENGYTNISLSPEEGETLKRLGDKYLILLRERRKGCNTFRGGISLNIHHEINLVVRKIIEKYHVEYILSNYKSCRMSHLYTAIDYSNCTQTWFKDCYSDLGQSTNLTNYYHFDNDINVSKAMIYLSEVNEYNGPFCFVNGSNKWNLSPTLMSIYSSIDRKISNNTSFILNLDNYHRQLFKNNRSVLSQLPLSFQGSTHFGDDLIDGSNLSETLLKNEVKFSENTGSLVLFDGYKGIHRGSTCLSGERLALQIAFQAMPQKTKLSTNIKRIILESSIGRIREVLKGNKLDTI